MLSIRSKGNYRKTMNDLKSFGRGDFIDNLDGYGRMGIQALASATPVKTGLTADSWTYEIVNNPQGPAIEWHNINSADGTPVVILLQYGHGTGTGGYVSGRDFINPAIQPIFDKIAEEVWKKVTK